MRRRQRQTKEEAGEIGGDGLAQRTDDDKARYHPNDIPTGKEQANVDEHAYANEEVGDKQCVANELDAVHQRRELWDVAVEDEAGEESTEDAFQPDELGECCHEKEHGHDKDELHDGIAVSAQETSCQPGNGIEQTGAVECHLQNEESPEGHTTATLMGGYDDGKYYEGQEQAHHCGTHTDDYARLALQPIAADNGVGDQRVRRHDTGQQQGGSRRIAQQADAGEVVHHKRYGEGQQTEKQRAVFVALQAVEVHLQRSQKHDVVEAHPSEEFKGCVARENVKTILSHEHTGQHHADDVRDAQLAHDDRSQQDDEQYHEKDQRGVGDGEV